jgi:cytochrome c553
MELLPAHNQRRFAKWLPLAAIAMLLAGWSMASPQRSSTAPVAFACAEPKSPSLSPDNARPLAAMHYRLKQIFRRIARTRSCQVMSPQAAERIDTHAVAPAIAAFVTPDNSLAQFPLRL